MVDPSAEVAGRRAIEDLYFGYRAFTAVPDRLLAARGLARAHHRVLYFVRRQPGIGVGELLATLAVSKQALNRPLKDLERADLIHLVADESDGRARRIRLTPAGEALEAELTASQIRLLDEAFAGIDDAARESWHTVMHRLAGTQAAAHPADD